MKKIITVILIVILLLILAAAGKILYNIRDRSPGYSLNLQLPAGESAKSMEPLKIGVAKVPITPSVEDTWFDADSNARYEPAKGDSFADENGNGKFDAFWLAGFHNKRPAAGVHDDIWARTVLWDDGNLCVALVVVDAIGLFHDDVVTIRRSVAEKKLTVDHVIVASTHCHEVPDLMGQWGEKFTKTGVNREYLKFVQQQTVKSIEQALKNRRQATIKLARIDSVGADLVRDSRPPYILDDALRMMMFCDALTSEPFGILLNYGNHPETLGSDNLLVTADYCHYWLEGIENGIVYDGEVKRPGIGVSAVFANGAIGGLMTSLGCTIYDPWLDRDIGKSSFEKARAQGYRLAGTVLDYIEEGTWRTVENPAIRLRAKTFNFKLQNKMFMLAGMLGLFDRGFKKFTQVRSEIDLLAIGPAWILTVPGEINPEIVNGGIEVPEGADYPQDPVEVPPIRQLMKGEFNFIIGLANDEVGYIMPKTQWDTEAPFTYGSKKGFYGEINSLGPDAGPTLYTEVKTLLESL